MFKDIFDAYWKGEDWTRDKVLEIQNPMAIKTNWPELRVYFGKGIDINEWADWNKGALSIINNMNSYIPMNSILTDQKLSMCLLDKGPRITPLGSVNIHYDLIWNMCFGANQKLDLDFDITTPESDKSLCLWYTKNKTKYIVEPGQFGNYDNFTKMIRIRSIDLADWKDMMRNYTKNYNNDCLNIDNDIPKRSIIVKNFEPARNG